MVFVEGVQRDDLKKGPGHYPGTPLPGRSATPRSPATAPRTAHPFYNLDKLAPGDKIMVQTFAGTFTYVVYKTPFAVKPTAYCVVANTPDAQLTLTSCNPTLLRGRAHRDQGTGCCARRAASPHKPSKRFNGHKVAEPRPDQLSTAARGSGQQRATVGVVGLLVALVGLLWWWAFRRWRHPLTWLIGLVPFLLVLFPFYVYLERALPNGY